MVAKDKSLLFCSTADCETVLNRVNSTKKKLHCINCNKNTCSECNQRFHGNINCEDHSAKHVYKWVTGVSINKCPKCDTLIEKNGGCPHMSCKNCLHDYCWTCGYGDDHFLHKISGEYGGILCELFNDIAGSKLSPCIQWFIIISAYIFMPLWITLGYIFGSVFLIF